LWEKQPKKMMADDHFPIEMARYIGQKYAKIIISDKPMLLQFFQNPITHCHD